MSTRLGKSRFFIIVFLVLIFLGTSQARIGGTFFIDEQIQIVINHDQIKEYDPINENTKSAYFGDLINKNAKLVYFGDLINENAKSAYYAYMNTKRLNIYGTDWLWRIDVLFIIFGFSLLLTNLSFSVFFRIASRFSARFSKSV